MVEARWGPRPSWCGGEGPGIDGPREAEGEQARRLRYREGTRLEQAAQAPPLRGQDGRNVGSAPMGAREGRNVKLRPDEEGLRLSYETNLRQRGALHRVPPV